MSVSFHFLHCTVSRHLYAGKLNPFLLCFSCVCVCSRWGFQYLQTLHLQSCDLLDVFGGISFFPLDKMTYLKIQSFVNRVEESLSLIKYTAFLYNDQLIWYRLDACINCVIVLKIMSHVTAHVAICTTTHIPGEISAWSSANTQWHAG